MSELNIYRMMFNSVLIKMFNEDIDPLDNSCHAKNISLYFEFTETTTEYNIIINNNVVGFELHHNHRVSPLKFAGMLKNDLDLLLEFDHYI